MTDTAIFADILALRPAIEGVSISGGEPFQQREAILDFPNHLDGSGLSHLAFSRYTLAEIRALPLGRAILDHLDVLISGRCVASQHLARSQPGSANQQIHLLTARHTLADFAYVPTSEAILHRDGSVTLSGVSPQAVRRPPSGKAKRPGWP